MSRHIAAWLCMFLIAASPVLAQHSATISFAQPAQPAGETISSTCVYRNGVKQLPCVQPTASPYTDTTVLGGLTYVYAMSNLDAAGIESSLSASVSAAIPPDVVPPPPPPPPPPQGGTLSFFPLAAVPANTTGGDTNAVELGMRFSVSVPGTITAVRFWKAASSTGTHTYHIWSPSGTSLASGSFFAETASGWQTAVLGTPLALSAGTMYTVSYHAVQYVDTLNYFTSAAGYPKKDAGGIITVPVSAGVYQYGPSSLFPASTWNSSNYWADVVFLPGTTAPAVSVTITPTSKTLQIGQVQQFLASVTGATDSSVTWSSNAPGGLFAAASSGTFTVTATSNADSSKSASAVVVVAAPPLTWTCVGNSCTATGGVSGSKVGTTLNGPSGNIQGTVTLP